MKISEEARFLDLDMVAEQILSEDDREMFLEAIRCYQIGSHRAAVILAWSATADCLFRRVQELAVDNDTVAKAALVALQGVAGQATFEETLIEKAAECELCDDFERKSLKYARDMRSKCAHPTGVVPSAEAVRHVLYICSQTVLCRQGYRGTEYVRKVVTHNFDDPHFFPKPQLNDAQCDAVIGRVSKRLWPLFTKLAAEERPSASPQTWQSNAITFFRRLLAKAEGDTLAGEIAGCMQGFQAGAKDFFALLVGLDPRVERFWAQEQRASARSRLRAVSAAKVDKEEIISWANICAADGLDQEDKDLLASKFGAMARHLPNSILTTRSSDVLDLVIELIAEDTTSAQAAIGLGHLRSSKLMEGDGDRVRRLVAAIMTRSLAEDRYRQLFEDVSKWSDAALTSILEQSETFLQRCSEDDPDRIVPLFEAAQVLLEHQALVDPDAFAAIVVKAMKGEIVAGWDDPETDMNSSLRSQAGLLASRHQGMFGGIEQYLATLARGGTTPEPENGEGQAAEGGRAAADQPGAAETPPGPTP